MGGGEGKENNGWSYIHTKGGLNGLELYANAY